MIEPVRHWLRGQDWWVRLRELEREGPVNALHRLHIQKQIDSTPPVFTDREGPVELRILTWRRDWRNAVWAIKSFYLYSGVTYPLFIHDGGWLPEQAVELRRHFPNAVLVEAADADIAVERMLVERGFTRSLEYRRKNGLTRQLFDFFLLSRADYVIILGSDLLFFKKPHELLVPVGGLAVNRYARDSSYFYSMTLDEIEAGIGVRPHPLFNTGPCVSRRASLDFELIERCLHLPKMFEENWVTEQTLHAICGSIHGAEHLPDTYTVEPCAIGPATLTCKHYPGRFRQKLYDEGMTHLARHGFLAQLREAFGTTSVA